jgi:hypothetical protein
MVTTGRTVRDVRPREILPLLANHLKNNGVSFSFAQCELPSPIAEMLEAWILNELAAILRNIYLLPRKPVPGFALPRGPWVYPKKQVVWIQKVSKVYVDLFISKGWIIKDRTGILFISQEFGKVMDDLAATI